MPEGSPWKEGRYEGRYRLADLGFNSANTKPSKIRLHLPEGNIMIRKYAVCSDGRRIPLPVHVQDKKSAEYILKTLGVNSFDFTLEDMEEALEVELTEGQKILLVGNARYEDRTIEDLIKSYNSLLNTCHEYQFYMKDYLCVTGRIMAFQQIRDEIKEYTESECKFSFLKKKAKESRYESGNSRSNGVIPKS